MFSHLCNVKFDVLGVPVTYILVLLMQLNDRFGLSLVHLTVLIQIVNYSKVATLGDFRRYVQANLTFC
jgi:hypothetical protein